MTTINSQCLNCHHFRTGYSCAAFPEGIAEEVLLNQKDHRQPLPGDNGIQFEAREGTTHPLSLE